jgi:hypothetical protein
MGPIGSAVRALDLAFSPWMHPAATVIPWKAVAVFGWISAQRINECRCIHNRQFGPNRATIPRIAMGQASKLGHVKTGTERSAALEAGTGPLARKKPICRPAPMINWTKPRGIESLVAHYRGVPDDDRLECDAFAFNPQEW